jgi:hypothetical protein
MNIAANPVADGLPDPFATLLGDELCCPLCREAPGFKKNEPLVRTE